MSPSILPQTLPPADARVESMKKLSLIPLTFVAAISLAACSGQSADDSADSTNAVEAWAAAVSSDATGNSADAHADNGQESGPQPAPTSPNNAAAPEGSVAPSPTQPPASNNDSQAGAPQHDEQPNGAQQQGAPQSGSQKENLDAILMNNFTIGDKVTISGNSATICLRGNGYGTGMLAAGPNTTCEFAKAVMGAQIQGRDATNDDIRGSLRSPVDVASPVTNETYSMNCSVDADRLITCTGGDNASVYMY